MPDTTEQMRKLLSAVATMTDEVQALKREVSSLRTAVDETKEIVEIWGAAKVAGRVVKWMVGFASGIAGLWVLAKTAGAGLFK